MERLPSQNTQVIGEKIRELRKAQGVTQVDLAAELGISRSYLTKIETGASLPGREVLIAVCSYFNISVDWLTKGAINESSLSEKEQMLIAAFRKMPQDEADAYLHLFLKQSGISAEAKILKNK